MLTRPLIALLLLCSPLTGCYLFPLTSEESREPTDEERLELYVTTATYLYEDGALERAQGQAIKALEIDPGHQAMRRMIGWIRVRMGSTADLLIAKDIFEQLDDEGDDNQATVLGRATTFERLGMAWGDASRRISDAIQDPAIESDALRESERLSQRSRKLLTQAHEAYSSTMIEGEGSTSTINGLQRVSALLGDYEESLEWSARLLQRAQEEIQLWDQLLQKKDLTEREARLYNENRRIASQLQLDTHLFAATLLHNANRSDEAILHLDAVIEVDPELPQGYSLRAQLLAKRGDFADAIVDLDRYLGLSKQEFEHPEITRAFELRTSCEIELARIARRQ